MLKWEFDKAVAKLKRDFQQNVMSEVRRRKHYMSPSVKKREKHRRALKRLLKRQKLGNLDKKPRTEWSNSDTGWKYFD